MEFLLAALTLGFLGSFHCVGMCGPIALALPVDHSHPAKRILGTLSYNLGRILTYGAMGALFGLLGKGFVMAGYQQWLSIGLGVAILVDVLWPKSFSTSTPLLQPLYKVVAIIKQTLGGLFRKKSMESLLFIGLLNGLLPCGLVYMGVAGAIATGSPMQGALFMMAFGLGTAPAMLGVTLLSGSITLQWRNNIRKAVPVVVSTMAFLLILRGLSLGIPYISPEMSKTDCTKHTCCHKK
jgi:sulfite exporter TauE/SafE